LFSVDSYHYLLPYSQDEETGEYLDPYGFAESGLSSGEGAGIVTGSSDPNNSPTGETFDSQIYLGTSWWQTYGAAPQINSISATCSGCSVPLVLNSSGTLTIVGVYLTADETDQFPTVNLSPMGQGLTLGSVVTVVSESELEVSYTVGSSPSSTGQYGITVTTNAGTSNSSTIKVGDPTPVITGVSPPSWMAGTSYPACSIQITGSGFGTNNPSLTITSANTGADGGPAITSYSVCSSSYQLITASVTTDASFTPGSATITVQSNGYIGSSVSGAERHFGA
jgi:hypothetical protein